MNARSRYFGQSAQQISADYFSWLLKARVTAIAAALALGLAAIMFISSGEAVAYIVCLVGVVVSAWVFKARVNSRFRSLLDILGSDCDAEKYREVIELIAQRDKKQRSKGTCLTELALAHYHAGRPMDALQLLSQVSFKSPKNILWVRTYNVEAIARNAAGDSAGRDAALERIAAFRAGASVNSPKRAVIDDILFGLNVRFRSPEQWGPVDLDYMRKNSATAESRLTWVSWKVCEAEYHLTHGNTQEARAILDNVAEGPVTPRAAANIERLRAML
ncbi:MAG: hypothetical protein Q4B69_02360 [Slackia sp.]|nr:hypothetical protein [Slackia sp.]